MRSEQIARIADPLPQAIVRRRIAPGRSTGPSGGSTSPTTQKELHAAQERLKFDELFILELGVAFRKHRVERAEQGIVHRPDGPLVERLLATVPFEPTKAQRRAMEEVGGAMARSSPMNVLLQGDVGSGKTLVALHAALVAIQSGHQAAVMAPTEVLAGQHFRSIDALLGPFGAVPFLDLAEERSASDGGRARCSIRCHPRTTSRRG